MQNTTKKQWSTPSISVASVSDAQSQIFGIANDNLPPNGYNGMTS